ncbi:MAG: AAA family ATPase [Thermoproteota archaeon]
MSASEELESLAVRYAKEAIELERKGSKRIAVTKYQRAIELLLKLCSLYPSVPQNKVYMDHVDAYKRRIQELQSDSVPVEHPADVSESRDSKSIKLDQWVLTEKPDINWDDIADLERPKRAIEESIIFPVRRPDLFPLGWPRGILFFGPPGCGKTLLAAAIASEIKGVFFNADAASLMSKWLGESERNVSQLFTKAREVSENGQPAIVFLDEIDSLAGVRGEEVGGEVRVRNQFLKEMDGILDKKRNYHVYVIGATNKPWVLDEPFIRRFQKRIYVPLPDVKARMDMFQIYAQNLKCDNNVDFAVLARLTEGYSGGDIRDLFQSTQLKVVRDFFQQGRAGDPKAVPDAITMEDFQVSLRTRRPSVSQTNLKRYFDWDESFRAS